MKVNTSIGEIEIGKMKCCICGNEIEKEYNWDQGHNAEPVKTGRCCTNCNYNVVVPERLKKVRQNEKKRT